MTEVTVVVNDAPPAGITAEFSGDRILMDPSALMDVIGWELRAEGLCRSDVCVPVRDRGAIVQGDRVDLAAVAQVLDRPVATDPDALLVAVGAPSGARREMLAGHRAPSFELPDLNGRTRSLEEFRDLKKLLFAFASW